MFQEHHGGEGLVPDTEIENSNSHKSLEKRNLLPLVNSVLIMVVGVTSIVQTRRIARMEEALGEFSGQLGGDAYEQPYRGIGDEDSVDFL